MVLFYRVVGSLAGLSVFGSGLIVITAMLSSRLRKHPYSLVMWLSICDFFFSLKYLFVAIYPNSWSLNDNKAFCQGTALSTNFFALASVSWSAVISFNLILSTAKPFGDTQGNTKWYHLFVWTISALSTLMVGLLRDTGVSPDGTCWFPTDKRFHWQFYAPLACYFALALFATVFAIFRTWHFSHGATRYAVKLTIRMTLYVAVFIASWLGPTVYEIYTTFRHVPAPSPPSIPSPPSAPSGIFGDGYDAHLSTTFDWQSLGPGEPSSAPISPPPTFVFQPGRFTWWTGVSVALVGFLNAIIWLSNPTFYTLIKNRIVRRVCTCWYNQAEKIPLIGKLESYWLEDQDHDLHQLNMVFRKNALSCLLLGIRYSLAQQSENQHFKSESLRFTQTLERSGRSPDSKRLLSVNTSPTPPPSTPVGQSVDDAMHTLDSHGSQSGTPKFIQIKPKEGAAKVSGPFQTGTPMSYDSQTAIQLRDPMSQPGSYGSRSILDEETDEEEDKEEKMMTGWSIPRTEAPHAVPVSSLDTGPFGGRVHRRKPIPKRRAREQYISEDESGGEIDVSVLSDAFLPIALERDAYANRSENVEDDGSGFISDDTPHIVRDADYERVEESDLSPENLELLDVPDLFTSPFNFRVFGADVFHNIRLRFGFKSRDFYDALAPEPFLRAVMENAEFSSGRSGSFMCYSPNRKFLIKTIPDHEAKTMVRILRAYHAHVESNPKTLLSPILGLYSIRLAGAPTLYIIIMANLFSHELLAPSIVYDLKGSWVDRGGKTKRGTRKDNDLNGHLLLSFDDSRELFAQLDADSRMLASQGVMDYSLLVGVRDDSPSKSNNAYIPPRKLRSSRSSTPSGSTATLGSHTDATSPSTTLPSIAMSAKIPTPRASPQRSRHTNSSENTQDGDNYQIPLDSDNLEARRSLMEESGINAISSRATCARVITSTDRQHTYIIGIIDILQSYNMTKKMERFIKVYFRCKSKEGLSAINPIRYQNRFRVAMARNIGYGDIDGDYDV